MWNRCWDVGLQVRIGEGCYGYKWCVDEMLLHWTAGGAGQGSGVVGAAGNEHKELPPPPLLDWTSKGQIHAYNGSLEPVYLQSHLVNHLYTYKYTRLQGQRMITYAVTCTDVVYTLTLWPLLRGPRWRKFCSKIYRLINNYLWLSILVPGKLYFCSTPECKTHIGLYGRWSMENTRGFMSFTRLQVVTPAEG